MNAISTVTTRATGDDWSRFMRPIAMAVRNTPGDEEFRARVAAITHAVAVPAGWLRQSWRQADAMRKFQFWPSVADVAEMFAEDLRAERETAARRAPLALPPPSQGEQRDPVAIAAVLAKARAFAAEVAQPKPDRAPDKPLPLSDGALLAKYEQLAAEGNTGAAIRVRMLRQRVGADA